MATILLIICVATCTNAFNAAHRQKTYPPVWRSNHFEERNLPDTLKGKPIHYIDSVFQAKRNAHGN